MTEHTFSAANVTEYVNKVMNEAYSVQFVRAFMKEEAKLTFKKVKQRPSSVNFAKIKESRRLFASKLGKLLTWETLVINIDESFINRHIKNSYSWSEKGIQKEAKSIIFSVNVSLVLALCSNGDWICLLTNTTIESNKFVNFIEVIQQWLQKYDNFGYNEVMYLLDNWPYHKNRASLSKLKKLHATIMFLPAYTPHYAPVEVWFSIVKNFLRSKCSNRNITLNLKHNYQLMHKALSLLKRVTVISLFRKVLRKINEDLIS